MIHKRLCWFGLVVGLFLGLLAGCGKSDSQPAASVPPSTINSQPSTPALKLHWLGKKRLATESNATNFMAIWNLPESARLEAQTLEKLSTAPWRLLKAATPLSNAPVALLRPLLDDLVQEESYLEVATATNQPAELVLAIRLSAERAALWQTNLASVLESLAGVKAATESMGWSLRKHDAPDYWQLTRAGNWTLLSATTGTNNALLANFQQRLARTKVPYAPRATNYWIEADVEVAAVGGAFRWISPITTSLRRVTLSLLGDGANVRTHSDVFFSQPVPIAFNAWNIPTNLISDQLVSFTALRLPDVPQLKSMFNLDLTECTAQRQVFVWALRTLPMATYAAVPTPAGSGCFGKVSQWLLTEANAWIETNAVGAFAASEDGRSVLWQGAPFMSAYAQSVNSAAGEFVLAGLVPTALTNRAATAELAGRMMQRTNLVYYDWEFTGPRVESWFYIGQLGRVLFGRQQLPQDSQGIAWLKTVGPKLGNAGTVAVLPEPQHLVLDRFATLGLTAVELHLFTDWLESTNFPAGTYTTSMPPRPLLRRKAAAPPPPN